MHSQNIGITTTTQCVKKMQKIFLRDPMDTCFSLALLHNMSFSKLVFSLPFYFMNTLRQWRSWCNVHICINPSKQIVHMKKYENRGLLYFSFSHDTAAEVKGHNVTLVVGGHLSLPQNSSRAPCARISSLSQSFKDHKSYITYHTHLPFPKILRLCAVLQAITLRHVQSQVSLHQYC